MCTHVLNRAFLLVAAVAVTLPAQPNQTKPLSVIRAAAERGSSEAQYELGRAYVNGEGVDLDLAQALNWIRKAVNSGNVNAQELLGTWHLRGYVVPKDLAEAARMFRKAAEQGNCLLYTSPSPRDS